MNQMLMRLEHMQIHLKLKHMNPELMHVHQEQKYLRLKQMHVHLFQMQLRALYSQRFHDFN